MTQLDETEELWLAADKSLAQLSLEDAVIPRYLRFKPETLSMNKDRHADLERANLTLHDRFVRMKRDKLCTHCARFTWKQMFAHLRRIKSSWDARFQDLKDDIPWHDYMPLPGVSEDVKMLADHPKYQWDISGPQEGSCALCGSLAILYKKSETAVPDHVTVSVVLYLESLSHEPIEEPDRCSGSESQDTLVAHTFVKGQHTGALRIFVRPTYVETEMPVEDEPPCLTERPLNNLVNVSLLANWLKTCDECHTHRHNPDIREARTLEGFRLIDVERHCIVEGSRHSRYAALSYTWGSREQYCLNQRNTSLLAHDGSLENIKGSLGPTITDAITICRSLRVRYLWVDSLCIIQDDVEAKQSQIDSMDKIYLNAYVTLVAAAGEGVRVGTDNYQNTPDPGLSRVTRPASSKPTSFHLDGQLYSIHINHSLQTQDTALAKSIWYTRGWTFQELILSHRILVFSDQEAFFYCEKGVLAESYFYTSDPSHCIKWRDMGSISLCGTLYKENVRSTARRMMIKHYYEQYKSTHLRLIVSYAGRILKYEGDILNAFSGLLSAQSLSLGKFHWGLPLRLFPRSLLLHIAPGEGLMTAHMSLRSGFPSWSWAGWKYQRASRSYIHDSLNDGNLHPLIQMYACDENAHLTLLYGPWDDFEGVEGYDSDAIAKYNELVPSDPLPMQPSIKDTPLLPPYHMPTSHILVFWTHVVQMESEICNVEGDVRNDSQEGREWRLNHTDGKYEIALIAMTTLLGRQNFGNTYESDGYEAPASKSGVMGEKYYGLIIERYRGFARRTGVLARITRKQWLDAEPKKELVLLI